ncbi:MAG: glycosyltransferase family 4 protein [Acidobacteria bacterium]|nr:glycosyltransferase family 4 protein [Acidobacteriota bacterium]
MARIGIDARKIADFGIGSHIYFLLKNFAEVDKEHRFFLFAHPDDAHYFSEFPARFEFVPEYSGKYSLGELFSLSYKARKLRLDLFHSPHYVLPFLLPCPAVVTVHDLIHLLFPQYLPHNWAKFYARYMIGRGVKRASRVITVSHSSKRDILRFFRVPEEKIEVIYNGVAPELMEPLSSEELDKVRRKYGIYEPFLLFVGNLKPHKNLRRLISSFARVAVQVPELLLVVVGDELHNHPDLAREVEEKKLKGRVRFFGYTERGELKGLYQLAEILVFPSLYEGFGLPPLEAMAVGTPVVASNVSSIPEVVGDAALLVDPRDEEMIAKGILRLLNERGLKQDLIEKGKKRAKIFSWRKTAELTLEVYNQVLR